MSFFFDRWFKFLFSALVFLFFLIFIRDVYAQPTGPPPPPYTSSAHGNSTTGVSGRFSGYGTGNCAHCHEQHASVDGDEPAPNSPVGPDEYLLFQDYQNYNYNAFCTGQCHKALGLGGDDISAQYDKSYHHPSTIGTRAPGESAATDFGASNRHSYCINCHNPHVAQKTTHSPGTNGASGPLLRVSGVTVGATGAWTTPSHTFIPAGTGITYEYQLCFKCHSTWPDADPPSGANAPKEFNTANPSYHPVEGVLSSPSAPLTAGQMTGWQNVGAQTMYCSDCHGSEASGDPAGPHGSTIPKILKGYWPKNAAGVLWNFANLTTDCLCKNCHPIYDGTYVKNEAHSGNTSGLTFDRHDTGYECVQCHVGLPHGYKWGRLIADTADGAPYNYGGLAEIGSFTRAASPTGYTDSTDYCTNPSSGCSGGSSGGYHGG